MKHNQLNSRPTCCSEAKKSDSSSKKDAAKKESNSVSSSSEGGGGDKSDKNSASAKFNVLVNKYKVVEKLKKFSGAGTLFGAGPG